MHGYPAFVGLGSNLREPARQVRTALAHLERLPKTLLVLASSLYGSKPMGPQDQPDYCNAVVGLLTALDSRALHAGLRAIERQMGREPTRERWGPRVIDLDLLAYGEERGSDPALTLPHPGIAERQFVLQPWSEIAPQFVVPGLGRVVELAARLPARGLWRME